MSGSTDRAIRWLRRVSATTAIGLLLTGATLSVAAAETRTLKFYNLHTRERAEIAYKRNGRYIPDGLQRINVFLRDWRRNQPTKMDPQLLDLVWEAYRQSGSRDYINVICGFRAPATNNMLRSRSSGVAKESQHTRGKALDWFLPDVPLRKLRDIGLKMQVGGVGYYPRSGSPFVHFDVGNARHWPRMSRKELAAVFPNGNTIHVPSDGKPLPGYQQALASYKARRAGQASLVANAQETRSGGRSLLATIFGGGSDEAEDMADADVAPAVRAAPAARGRTAPAAAEPAAPRGGTAVAAVTPSNRPALPGGVAVGMASDFDTSAPAAAAPAPAEASTAVAALQNIPVPTFAPVRPEAGEPITSTMVAALEDQAARAAADPAAAAQLAYAVPTPKDRPIFEEVLKGRPSVAVAEAPAPGASIEDVLARAAVPAPAPAQASAPAAAPAAVAPASAAEVRVATLTPTPRPEIRPTARAETAARTALPAAAAVPAPVRGQSAPAPAAAHAKAVPATATGGKTGRVVRAAIPTPGSSQDAIASRIDVASAFASPDDAASTALIAKMGRLISQRPDAAPAAAGFSNETAGSGRSSRFSASALD
ncbi:DUF882 domain-containing protein [Antarcticirhabdus aurantiaca]|uniref:DUF882 domain-containing protein n=1 Tax=Antarcticirhabdus aurantiaca TaxID=2606717 RepID=A0ACD4NU27_9HYPH|nr:DUF882 domain-containing protein [Antarcticirhabdus aurantiaca]WAJ30550.1 DUF882 domain-containing protein [Jeongeuplla avenae]